MFKHWFILLLRHIRKHRLFSIINLLSLVIGFMCCLAIFLYIQDELAYDRFHENAARITRITTTSKFNGTENRYSRTPVPLAEHIKSNVKEATLVGRVTMREATLVVPETKMKLLERNFYFADPEILSIFSFNFLYGEPSAALKDRGAVILTESIAKKYFISGAQSIGQTLTVENQLQLTVTAVISDWPTTSHLQPEIITHFDNYILLESEGIQEFLKTDWLYSSVLTYVLLSHETALESASSEINQIRKQRADERVVKDVTYSLQPITDIRLHSNFSFEEGGAIRYIYIFGSVGGLLLIIACFNFINLSIARSLKRSKEIGMKKVLGLHRSSLRLQLLGESLLFIIIAFVAALLLTHFSLPTVNSITGKTLTLLNLVSPINVLLITCIVIATGFFAGWYPAVYITGIDAYKAIKGQLSSYPVKFNVRKILVVVQFFVAIALILFTMTVNRQLDFMQRQPLGFQQRHMLTIPLFSANFNSIIGTRIDADYRQRMIAFEESVLKNPRIEAITCSSFLPGQGAVAALVRTDSLTEASNVFIPSVSVDYDFIDTYKIKLVAGRSFDRSFGTDHLQAFIVNEEAVKVLGFKSAEHAIGQRLSAVGKNGYVVGVITNYHIQGLQFSLQPLILEAAAHKFSTFSVRLHGTDIPASIAALKTQWDLFFPETIFEYTFLEEALQENYVNEERLMRVVSYFSTFTYVIAVLGLFGLGVYINEQRAREVGIRKVLGATTFAVFLKLSSDLLKLIAIACLLAVPASIYAMFTWLEDFYYKVTPNVWMFITVIGGTLGIALFTIAYQTFRSATTNPADVLRAE